jgi:urease accessory protein
VAELTASGLLGLLRLGSAALPIGAFAYSQGLEQAILLGAVSDQKSAAAWTCGLLEECVLTCDVPILSRLHGAFECGDSLSARRWNDCLFASRPTRELRAEERQLGSALARLLSQLGERRAEAWRADPRVTLATSFALASSTWGIPAREAAMGYAFAWAEAQVGAATRLIPLGQSAAQLTLSALLERAALGLNESLALTDAEIAASATGQAVLSALHETQYSRLFRS